jgi:transcriptional regulator with XRE-family HTH domain
MSKSVFTDAYKSLLAFMKQARLDAGVSQAELAGRLGKPQQFVSSVELGVRRVDVVEFCAIMQALGLDPSLTLQRLVRRFPSDIRI